MPIAGSWCPGRPPDAAALDHALTALAVGDGRKRMWSESGIALGWTADMACFARTHGSQPSCGAVVDGVIHNRSDVARTLGLDATPDDAALAGEFACALWDGGARRLLLARDAVGCLPLHYWQGGGRLLFAGEPRGLLTDPAVPRELDETKMALWLSLLPDDDANSLYRDIRRVRPGHFLSVAADGALGEHRYWRPETVPVLRLKSAAAYEEALRDTLDAAVRCRLPASGTIGVTLSGGLDSTCVATLAARRLAEQGRRLTALTVAPSKGYAGDPSHGAIHDESALAALVCARHPNIDHVVVRPDGTQRILSYCESVALHSGIPARSPSDMPWWDALFQEARQRRVAVLLNGNLGNLTISYDGALHPASLLRAGALGPLLRDMSAAHRAGRRWRGVVWECLAPLMSATLRRAIWRACGHAVGNVFHATPLNPELARDTGLADRLAAIGGDLSYSFGTDSRAMRLALMARGDRGLSRVGTRRLHGIQATAPCADRRVIELAFAIPDEQYRKDGMPRSLIRRAMAELLPPEVVTERRRGQQGSDWGVYLTAARAEFAEEMTRLEHSPLAQRCLDIPRLRRIADNWPADFGTASATVLDDCRLVLNRGLAAGRFIRSFEGTNR
jgi:asparagine synthase (glutamine-hydrolysing)